MTIQRKLYAVFTCLQVLFLAQLNYAQPAAIQQLEQCIYKHNNAFHYDSSILLLQKFISKKECSNEEKYYANIYFSYTYKRLFDYASVQTYLDKALQFGLKCSNPDPFIANINSQKAFAYFDVHNYGTADSIMHLLQKSNYNYLNTESKSKIIMQQAYLLYLKKDYANANIRYDTAIAFMLIDDPCDLPMIYGKKIELYGAMHLNYKMQEAYKKCNDYADTCGILKYKIYAAELMWNAFKKNNDFENAFKYFNSYDSLNKLYNQTEHLSNITALDNKNNIQIKEHEITIQEKTIELKNKLIALLIISVISIVLIAWLYWALQKKRKIEKENADAAAYTKQLLTKTEEERKRIAADLHDSISHQLLNLKTKNPCQENVKIDHIINDIRIISRNLHPIMFEQVGLKITIEQMVERVQLQNNFMLTADITYNNSLSKNNELQLYRIIQEAINNIIKYANAVAGKITITEKENIVLAEIKDNGKGFSVAETLKSNKAFGLHNIIERSRSIGGEAKIQSSTHGTVITITIKT